MKQQLSICLATLCLLVLSHSIEANDFWPGWLGPNRDGWVKGFTPPAQWPERLHEKWHVDVGTGYGSPLVAEGLVFTHTREGEHEVVQARQLTTGKIHWQQRFTVPFKIGGGGEYHGKGPKSCPLLVDKRLVTMNIDGALRAWDSSSGKKLWQQDYSDRFKKGHPFWGATTSPVSDGKRVFVHVGTDGEGALVALDVATGKEVWQHGQDSPSYSSPLLLKIHDVMQVVDWNQRVLTGVECVTGKLLWEFSFPRVETNQNMPTPTYHEGTILLGAENRGFHGLAPQLKEGRWTVKELWFQKEVALDMSSAVINGKHLFGLSHYGKGRIFCLDPSSGAVLWQGPGRSGANATLLSVKGHVLALLDNGELQVVRGSSSGYEKIASYRVTQNATWAPPVLLENGILVKDVKTLTYWSFGAK